VKHKTKPIQGRVVGVTRMKKLFERAADDIEYRVETKGGIKIVSASNLVPLPAPPKLRVQPVPRLKRKKHGPVPKVHTCGWSGRGDRQRQVSPGRRRRCRKCVALDKQMFIRYERGLCVTWTKRANCGDHK
jgi:hypothetical protein